MTDNSGDRQQFGLLVAYVLPGFIALAGLAPLLPSVAAWLRPVDNGDLGLGPPVYAVLAATALGLILSCFRWLLLDQLHQATGVQRPAWDDRKLAEVLGGFDYLVQSHFRYYEFTGNALLALAGAYGLNRILGTLPSLGPATDGAMLVLIVVLFAASRDALARYYARTGLLVGHVADKERSTMFNGNDHGGGNGGKAPQGTPPRPRPDPKPHPQSPQPAAQPRPQSGKGKHARR